LTHDLLCWTCNFIETLLEKYGGTLCFAENVTLLKHFWKHTLKHIFWVENVVVGRFFFEKCRLDDADPFSQQKYLKRSGEIKLTLFWTSFDGPGNNIFFMVWHLLLMFVPFDFNMFWRFWGKTFSPFSYFVAIFVLFFIIRIYKHIRMCGVIDFLRRRSLLLLKVPIWISHSLQVIFSRAWHCPRSGIISHPFMLWAVVQ
jgi:hypothetical protein